MILTCAYALNWQNSPSLTRAVTNANEIPASCKRQVSGSNPLTGSAIYCL